MNAPKEEISTAEKLIRLTYLQFITYSIALVSVAGTVSQIFTLNRRLDVKTERLEAAIKLNTEEIAALKTKETQNEEKIKAHSLLIIEALKEDDGK